MHTFLLNVAVYGPFLVAGWLSLVEAYQERAAGLDVLTGRPVA